jgi:hypothetical protein
MKTLPTVPALLGVASLLTACAGSEDAATHVEAIRASKVDVCLYLGNGDVNVINVAAPAAANLLDRGNQLAGDWTVDADGDGFGAGAAQECPDDADAIGWTTTSGDCDDGDAASSPAAEELCGDSLDNDCDGQVDEDCVVEPEPCPCFTADDVAVQLDLYEAAVDAFAAVPGAYIFWSDRPALSGSSCYGSARQDGQSLFDTAGSPDLIGLRLPTSWSFRADRISSDFRCAASVQDQVITSAFGAGWAPDQTSIYLDDLSEGEFEGCLQELQATAVAYPDYGGFL